MAKYAGYTVFGFKFDNVGHFLRFIMAAVFINKLFIVWDNLWRAISLNFKAIVTTYSRYVVLILILLLLCDLV